MESNIKELIKLSREELNNKIGNTIYDRLKNLFKALILFITIWFTLEYFMGYNELINSHPFILWLLSGITPSVYMIGVLYDSIKYKGDKPFVVVNISNFMLFLILLFIQIVVFRIFGFEIDCYYSQMFIFMLLAFLFMELCSVILINLGKINKRINELIELCILPLFAFSGIVFQFSDVSNRYLKAFLKVNPFTYIVHGFRSGFIYKKWYFEEPKRFAYFASICLFMLVILFIISKISKKK